MIGIVVGMLEATNKDVLFLDQPGLTIMSRGGRLYVRHQGEFTEINGAVRVIIGSGFGFVVTGDAIEVCVRRHIEMIITNVTQSFVAIYAPYAPCQSSRTGLTIRVRQFAAVADRDRKLRIAKSIMKRKIMAEHHDRDTQASLLTDAACKSTAAIRHVEARSAQEWWRQWRDFEIKFERKFKPPKQWYTFQTRYIGRRQGKVGELPRQFTARFAETPLQALHNFVVAIVVARITRVITARGLDPCFAFLHDGRKPGRFSLAWDGVEVFRPMLARAIFEYAAKKVFGQADFASQAGVVRLSPWTARECATIACKTAPLIMLVREVRRIENVL